MARETHTGRSRTYSVNMAPIQLAQYPVGGRQATFMEEKSKNRSVQNTATQSQGESRLGRIIDSLDRSIPLPDSRRSFLKTSGVLLVIFAGLMVNVLLSVQILEARVKLADIQNRHAVVERQSGELLWLIGRATNLQVLQERARAAGYIPITEREFVRTYTPEVARTSPDRETISPTRPGGHDGSVKPESPASTAPDLQMEDMPAAQEQADAAGLAVEPVQRTERLQQWRAVLFPDDTLGAASPQDSAIDPAFSNVPTQAQSVDSEVSGEPSPPAWTQELVDNVTSLLSRFAGP